MMTMNAACLIVTMVTTAGCASLQGILTKDASACAQMVMSCLPPSELVVHQEAGEKPTLVCRTNQATAVQSAMAMQQLAASNAALSRGLEAQRMLDQQCRPQAQTQPCPPQATCK